MTRSPGIGLRLAFCRPQVCASRDQLAGQCAALTQDVESTRSRAQTIASDLATHTSQAAQREAAAGEQAAQQVAQLASQLQALDSLQSQVRVLSSQRDQALQDLETQQSLVLQLQQEVSERNRIVSSPVPSPQEGVAQLVAEVATLQARVHGLTTELASAHTACDQLRVAAAVAGGVSAAGCSTDLPSPGATAAHSLNDLVGVPLEEPSLMKTGSVTSVRARAAVAASPGKASRAPSLLSAGPGSPRCLCLLSVGPRCRSRFR